MKLARFAALAAIVLAVAHLFGRERVMEIVISKSDRTLVAFGTEGRVLKRTRIGLGRSEVGHKYREGDERTPEGEYRVCFKNPQSRFRLSFGLDYPNPADAAKGLRDGAITQAEHDAIVEAHRRGFIPPWKTALGGEIFIHGGLDVHPATAGCVAIRDRDVEELFPLVDLGTRVRIVP
jgi:murein L,D-transpeptidase YafK